VRLKLGEIDQSIRDYDAAVALNPSSAAALYGRGLAKQKKGDRAGADADLAAAKAIRSDVADEFAKLWLE
jgi:tetratricopeptide (TPR) repeat protein